MPLTAVHAEFGLLDATAVDLAASTAWEKVHRVTPPAPLTCRACTATMSAKLSLRGMRFFAHRAGVSDCPTSGETLAHRLLKVELATAIREAGWYAELEVPGNGWRADVLATSPDGSRRIAWEAQLAAATVADLAERTATMAADGVEVCWVGDKDVPWVTHVPSARVRRPEQTANTELAGHGQPGLVVIDGHGKFEPDWCDNRDRCAEAHDYGLACAPCPGHGQWIQAQPVPLATFVAALCHGVVRHYDSQERIWRRSGRHEGGTSLWVTRPYWKASEEQRAASEMHDRYAAAARARAESDQAEHQARTLALVARQDALIKPTVEWVFQTAGTYPRVEPRQRIARFAMGVPVFIGDKLHAVICPVATRITPGLAGWFSSAVVVVADEGERAYVANRCRPGQRFKVIDPGPLLEPV